VTVRSSRSFIAAGHEITGIDHDYVLPALDVKT